jgi:hypothetical protein
MWKNGLVVGIIIMLVGVCDLSSVSSKNVIVSNEKIEECNIVSIDNLEPKGLLWGTYINCRIYGDNFNCYPFEVDGYAPFIFDFDINTYVILDGFKGERFVLGFIGFGFRGIIKPPINEAIPGYIDGELDFCIWFL